MFYVSAKPCAGRMIRLDEISEPGRAAAWVLRLCPAVASEYFVPPQTNPAGG